MSKDYEKCLGSSYHVTIQSEHNALSGTKVDELLGDIVFSYNMFVNENDPQEEEDAGDGPLEHEVGV